MNNLEFFTPSDIPTQIKAFDSKVKQLGVGKAGKKGLLQIEFQKEETGKTILSNLHSEVPLHAQRALYYDESNLAYLYIVSASGGILQGDRYRIDIRLKKGSHVHLTTQGATRIYSMKSNCATQMVNITLEENSYLEFIPDQIIPYENSRFYQKLDIDVHDTATLIYSEILTPGRIAMGENFVYDVCYLKTKGVNQNGKFRFMDIVNIEPKKQNLSSFGILQKYRIAGSVYILTQKHHSSELYEKINFILSQKKGIFGGVSLIKNDSGLIIRILGNKTEQVKNLIFEILAVLRKKIINAPFCGIRKS